MTEVTVDVRGVEICTEPFGDPADPPILLVMGLGASMVWWEDGFCRMLADAGRFVIRYDHRDTGRSTAFRPGHPTYTGGDLVLDAVGVLDAYGLRRAHLVGVSAGGGIAQALALDAPDRVVSLVLISSSPVAPVDRPLPPPTPVFGRFLADSVVDWADQQSVIEYLVGYARLLAGDQRPFDDTAWRDLIRRDVTRANRVASLQNHDVIAHDDGPPRSLSSLSAPTVVIHGTADPLFPLPHGQALAEAIPGARLLGLEGAGHGVDRADWAAIARAVVGNTTPATTRGSADSAIEGARRGSGEVSGGIARAPEDGTSDHPGGPS